jgi:hypothetical protein
MLKRINKPAILIETKDYANNVREETDKFIRDVAEMQRDFSLAEQRYLVKGELPDRIQQGTIVYIHNCDYAPNGLKLRWI